MTGGRLTFHASAPEASLRSLLLMLCLAVLLAGCGTRPDAGILAVSQQTAPGATAHRILVATTREPDERPGTLFGRERSSGLHFAEATVSVPPVHEAGKIEWPSSPPGNPKTDFTVEEKQRLDEAAFRATLNAQLAALPKDKREVFVFIHGYNTRFPEALYRMVQLKHDSGMPYVAVLFTWASGGNVTDYLYDSNSATIARDGLERTLRLLAESKAEKVNVLAHSMGTWVLTETLRQIRISGRPLPERKVGVVAMAAPDLDVDVFKAQMRRAGKPKKPFILLVSRDDRALRASSLLAGGKQRLGAYEDEAELAELGAIVIDLTDISGTDAANHGKFAEIAQAAPELRSALRSLELRPQVSTTETTVDVVGNTAKAAVTFPLKILTAPLTALSNRQ